MKQFFLCLTLLLLNPLVHSQVPGKNIPDFSGFTRGYLSSLSPEDVKFILDGNKDGAQPNYNWSLAYGLTPICTIAEVKRIRSELGSEAFSKYGELINFGWLYDQREFESTLRKFQVVVKRDKSAEARVIQHVVDKALHPANIEQQKRLIENEIERNEKRLSEKSGLSREKAALLAKGFSRRFKDCLGRYQTGYISLAVQINND